VINLPKVSIVVPTLNAASVLRFCLESIDSQDYPKEKVEIIVADGGSIDDTLAIAAKFGAKIVKNDLKTAEAGKAVGVGAAGGELIALVDSDNILPTNTWLQEMVGPLMKEPAAVGSEPWKYTWRKKDGFITRYCALIGMNDPFVHFLGNYDRVNLLTGKWTEVARDEQDKGSYLLVKFNSTNLPTIGANGTVFRTQFLKENLRGSYLFDIDILASYIKKSGAAVFIKVKNGIIHTYCERDIGKFARKQRRRVRDYLFHRNVDNREYEWRLVDVSSRSFKAVVIFVFYCLTFFPLVIQTIRGYMKKKDSAWFFHPLACLVTLWEYSLGTLVSVFNNAELSRKEWKQ